MCDSLVAAPTQTVSGHTLYAKNSDRKPGECQPFVQFPAANYPRASRLRCTHIEIAQVPETYRVMGHSPWWVWGFEHGVNEHAVAIGNHTVFSNESIEAQPGLIGMDLVRLGLERGRTAREALEIVAGLLERHGQGGPALEPGGSGYHNSFVLADAREAWHLETSNRRWVARRLSLGAVSNHLAIGSDWEIASRDAQRFAVAAGWSPRDPRLDFAAAYRNPHVPAHISAGRQRSATDALAAQAGCHDAESFIGALRNHGGVGETWQAGDATPDDERFFTLCAHCAPVHQTTASLVVELPPRPGEKPWPAWVSFGAPCTGIFLPVYIDGVLPAAMARGNDASEADSLWCRLDALQRAVEKDPARYAPDARAAWAQEAGALALTQHEAESRAWRQRADGDADASAATLTAFMQRSADRVLEVATALERELAAGG